MFNDQRGGQSSGAKGEILKIQVAQDAPEGSPMLMYNEDKSKKTFIHPNCTGYNDIQRLILEEGQKGKLAQNGGLKAFFWGRQHRKVGRKFVLVNTEELAPSQPW